MNSPNTTVRTVYASLDFSIGFVIDIKMKVNIKIKYASSNSLDTVWLKSSSTEHLNLVTVQEVVSFVGLLSTYQQSSAFQFLAFDQILQNSWVGSSAHSLRSVEVIPQTVPVIVPLSKTLLKVKVVWSWVTVFFSSKYDLMKIENVAYNVPTNKNMNSWFQSMYM